MPRHPARDFPATPPESELLEAIVQMVAASALRKLAEQNEWSGKAAMGNVK